MLYVHRPAYFHMHSPFNVPGYGPALSLVTGFDHLKANTIWLQQYIINQSHKAWGSSWLASSPGSPIFSMHAYIKEIREPGNEAIIAHDNLSTRFRVVPSPPRVLAVCTFHSQFSCWHDYLACKHNLLPYHSIPVLWVRLTPLMICITLALKVLHVVNTDTCNDTVP